MHTDQPGMSLVASRHEEDGRAHNHPEYPGKEKVVPGPIPTVDIGIPEKRDDEGDRSPRHDFEDGCFHTW